MKNQFKEREEELLDKAIEAFWNTTGLNMIVERTQQMRPNYAHNDVILNLETKELKKQFAGEIKGRLNAPALGPVIHQLKNLYPKGILITDYVNPNMAEKLKEEDIPFIDTAGNIYLNEQPVFIYVKGNRPNKKFQKEKLRRAFQATGLKVLFALFCKPQLVNAPYRYIAEEANVALGTVGWVLIDLKEMGFLKHVGKNERKLVNKEKLLEIWTIIYPERLRPKLKLGRYTAQNPDWYKNTELNKYEALLGGEVGAAKLTNYLKPALVTIYIKNENKNFNLNTRFKLFLLDNKLKKDPRGEIEILEIFWGGELTEQDTVPPLLIYADLLATGDARNIETAKMIYENELIRLVE